MPSEGVRIANFKPISKMRVYRETTLLKFKAWEGGEITQKRILNEDKGEEFDALIEELYPDGIDETALNDLLWFDSEWIFKCLGMTEETEEN
jgi:hypothetical protein